MAINTALSAFIVIAGPSKRNQPWNEVLSLFSGLLSSTALVPHQGRSVGVEFQIPGSLIPALEFSGERVGSVLRDVVLVQIALPEAPPDDTLEYLLDRVLAGIALVEEQCMQDNIQVDILAARAVALSMRALVPEWNPERSAVSPKHAAVLDDSRTRLAWVVSNYLSDDAGTRRLDPFLLDSFRKCLKRVSSAKGAVNLDRMEELAALTAAVIEQSGIPHSTFQHVVELIGVVDPASPSPDVLARLRQAIAEN